MDLPRHCVRAFRIGWAPLLLTLLLSITGCDGQKSAEEYFQHALALKQAGDVRAEVIELKNALQQRPEYGDARWELGKAYIVLGNGAAAEKELGRARELGHDDPELRIALLQSSLLLRRYPQILRNIKALGKDGEQEAVRLIKADALLGLHRLDDAKAVFRALLERNPKNSDAKVGLARVAMGEERYQEAETYLQEVLETSPSHLQALVALGELALRRPDYAKAGEAFEKALEVADYSAAAHLGLSKVLLARKEPKEAEVHIRAAGRQVPSSSLAMYLWALAKYQQADYPNAQTTLRSLLTGIPGHPQSLYLLGAIHYAKGEYEQAEQPLTRLLRTKSGYLPAYKLLSVVYLKLDQPGHAVSVLLPAVKAKPGDVQLLTLLGGAYLANRQFDEASTYLEKAAKLVPEDSQIRLHVARSDLAAGKADKAVAVLRSILEKDPDLIQADYLLVLTHLNRRDFDQALAAARQLVERHPDSPLGYQLLARASEGKDDLKQARRYYDLALSKDPAYAAATFSLARMDLQAGKPEAARRRYTTVLELDGITLTNFKRAALALAKMDLQEGQRKAARSRYQAILDRRTNDPDALVGLAELAASDGRREEIARILERARSANPRAIGPRTALARLYLSEGNADKALHIAREAYDLAPHDPSVLLTYGDALRAAGQYKDARETYQGLIRRFPESPDAYYGLAAAAAASGDSGAASAARIQALELARAALRSLMAADPEATAPRYALARIELLLGDRSKALEMARGLQKDHPEEGAGFQLEGDLRLSEGKPGQAATLYRKALSLQPSSELLLKLYAVQRKESKERSARMGLLRGWLDQHPNDARVRLALIRDLIENSEKDEAVAELERLRVQHPDSPVVLNDLAWLYQEKGDPRALTFAKLAYEKDPTAPNVMDTYGWILVSTGKTEQGIRLLRQAAERAPRNLGIRYRLAVARMKAGDRDGARSELDALLESSQPFSERAQAEKLRAVLR